MVLDWLEVKMKVYYVRVWGIKVSEGICNCMEILGRVGVLVVSDELIFVFVL